jgi:hypothetical protein
MTPVKLTTLYTHLLHTHTLARDALSHADVGQLKSKRSIKGYREEILNASFAPL